MRWRVLLTAVIVLSVAHIHAQRRSSKVDNMSTDAELIIQRSQDSIQRLRDSFEQNFNTREYFAELKRLRDIQNEKQLDRTLKTMASLEMEADTLTTMTIQSASMKQIPNGIQKFSKLKFLTIRRCYALDLTDLFEKIKDLPQLTHLEIIHCQQADLPDNIQKLKALESLNLNGNKFYHLPNGLSLLPRLKEINLHNNVLLESNHAAEILSRIKSLRHIDMSGCRLTDLGENFGKLTQIQSLDLHINSIERLPASVEQMASLRELNISNNPKLQSPVIFYDISKLKNLETLSMIGCNLQDIPSSIVGLQNLKYFYLQDNPIQSISKEIGSLTHLEEIYLGQSSNTSKVELKTLPHEIGKCVELKKIDLRMAGLEQLPTSLASLENLTYLDLSWNQFKSFPEVITKLSNLQYLDISRNKINQFPTQLGKLGNSLETLILEGNFYSKFPEKISKIPPSITTLKKLKVLSLKDQVFESLPSNFWESCSGIISLNLSGALLQEIPDEVGEMKSLQTFIVKGNELKSISPKLVDMKTLETLDISSNPELNHSTTFEILKEMKQLKKLDISYNDIRRQIGIEIKAALPHTEVIKREMKDSPEYEKPQRKD